MRAFRILVADDHAVVRHGLRLLIESQSDMTVVGDAADGVAVLEQAKTLNPDLVILDISMPGMGGLEATRALRSAQPGVRILVLTRHEEEMHLEELLRAGASGYVLKQSAPQEFLGAIRAVAAGGIYVDPALAPRVADGLLAQSTQTQDHPQTPISEREAEVLRLIATGHSNKEVATRLAISVKTVEVHKTKAMRKLGLNGRVDLIRYGSLKGWLHDT